jgi:hypothetical protein
MKIDHKNITISVVSFSLGFCFFWFMARGTISDMEEINYKTIELMEQYENLLKKMVKQVENKWVLSR